MSDRHRIEAGGLSATIQARGAELVSLRDAAETEYLWQAGPEWRRHAPVLFPIVGRLAGDTLRHGGAAYRMGQHGFARDRRFEWLSQAPDACRLRLADDADSRAFYPFAFTLELGYALSGGRLEVVAEVANPGEAVLPFSIGAHPAFRWPLAPGVPKDFHRLVFERPETGPAHRLEEGLLGPAGPSPVESRVLPLSPTLFARDALILPGIASRALRYEVPDGPALDFRWEGYPDLGLWSKPEGAEFLCLEPWQGMSSPVGWDGDFAGKPGVVLLPPGQSRRFTWSVGLG